MGIQKAVTALLSSSVALAAMYFPEVNQFITDEEIAPVAALLTTFLVWLVPNK